MEGWEKKPNGWEKFKIHINDDHFIYNYDISTDVDAIFVLAGGLEDDGNLKPWVYRRLDLAIHLYQSQKEGKKPKIICLGGGTYHKPPILNSEKYVVHESTPCAEYLLMNDIPKEAIMREWASFDTIANAYFALTNFIIPQNLKYFAVITSQFHMSRSKLIVNWIIGMYKDINILYLSASDIGLPKEIIESRNKREKQSIEKLKKLIPTVTISQTKLDN